VIAFFRDFWMVLKGAPVVELGRLRQGPGPLLKVLRAQGQRGRVRSDRQRARLSRLIGFVDACFPGGGNCYRRALLEISIDPVAAAEPLRLGLRSGGGLKSGHAWLGPSPGRDTGRYDAEFCV
jgi:hypothetical protein